MPGSPAAAKLAVFSGRIRRVHGKSRTFRLLSGTCLKESLERRSAGGSSGGESGIFSMSSQSRIDVSKVGDVTVVKFKDKKILDEVGIQELGAELFGLVEQQNRRAIVLNFDGVDFLSSAALGKLITFDRKVKGAKGRMKLCGIRPEILEVFQVTKLNKVFDIRGEEAEAISALG